MKRKIQILTICALSILSIHFIQSRTLQPECPPGCACVGNAGEYNLDYNADIYDCKTAGCNCWGG